MYGIQTRISGFFCHFVFENDVKMYGIQTKRRIKNEFGWFENDVKMYGIQTVPISTACPL